MATEVSPREAEVLAALGERLTNAEVAARLHLSERTVESHVSSLLRKLGAGNRLELAALARPTRPLPGLLRALSDPGTFVGRHEERALLDGCWSRALTGESRGVLVTAEAGMGKSRLVSELARRVHDAAAQVLLGACHENGGIPYEPFTQLLEADVDALPSAEVDRRRGRHANVLVRLGPGGAPPDALLDPATSRATVRNALHGYLARAADRPTLVVLEDVHWTTETTTEALRHLLELGGSAPLLVVLTARDVPPDLDHELSLLFADLERLPAVDRLRLPGLGRSEVAELVGHLGSALDPEEVEAQTAGNPLLVHEVAGGPARGLSLPSLLLRRYALLDGPALATLDAAAVLGARFDATHVALLTGRPLLEVLRQLEQAAAAGLLVVEPDGQCSFWHGLFRTARYDELAPSTRRALHQAAAANLQDRLPPAVVADHALLGGARDALALVERAAAEAERAYAFHEAAGLYRRALALADDARDRLHLETRLGELLQAAGDPGFREVLLAAAATARELGEAEALARVGWAMVRYGGPGKRGRVQDELGSITEDALAAIGPAPTAARARTLAVAAEEQVFFDPSRALALAEEARSIALGLDDPATLGHVLLSYRVAARTPDNAEAGLPTADALVEIGRVTGDPTFVILGLSTRAWSLREVGRLEEANAAMDQALALRDERLLPPTYVAAVTMFQSSRASLRGDLGQAEETATSVFSLVADYDPTNWYGPAIVMLRHAQGRLPELLPLLEGAVAQVGIDVVYRSALAVAYGHADRVDEARALVDDLVVDDLAKVPWNLTWLACMAALAEAVELIGDAAAARAMHARLLPFAGRIADIPQSVIAPVDLVLGQLALTTGDRELAAGHLVRAVEASRLRSTPVFLARELLRLSAATGDGSLVPEALELGERYGAGLVAQEAARLGAH